MVASETAASAALNNAPETVRAAIHAAGGRSAASFAYLVKTAAVESGFDADARATTSSASGLYQFVKGTWLDMVEQHGGKIGLGRYADALKSGQATKGMEGEILALRDNPKIAAFMASAYADQNKSHLETKLGRDVNTVDQYLAHFLGPSGATTFLDALTHRPDTRAASLLPAAAEANRAVFYRDGAPRSLREVYDFFAQKFDRVGTSGHSTERDVLSASAGQAGGLVARPTARVDTPPFSASAAFMVHVLLDQLEANHKRQIDDASRTARRPGDAPASQQGAAWSTTVTA